MTRVLVLNSWFLPKRVVSWQDAIVSLVLGKSEAVINYSETVHSPSVAMQLPAVIREKRNTARNKKVVKFSRGNVYTRDNYTCQYCGHKFAAKDLTYDHVVPRARGGRTEWSNIVTCCRDCNTKKGNKTCDEWGRWPLRDPVQPKSLPVTGIYVDKDNAPEEWVAFLK